MRICLQINSHNLINLLLELYSFYSMNSLFFVPVVRHSFVSLYSLPTCSVFCIIFSIFLSNLKKKAENLLLY